MPDEAPLTVQVETQILHPGPHRDAVSCHREPRAGRRGPRSSSVKRKDFRLTWGQPQPSASDGGDHACQRQFGGGKCLIPSAPPGHYHRVIGIANDSAVRSTASYPRSHRTGPMTEPCGTPQVTTFRFETRLVPIGQPPVSEVVPDDINQVRQNPVFPGPRRLYSRAGC